MVLRCLLQIVDIILGESLVGCTQLQTLFPLCWVEAEISVQFFMLSGVLYPQLPVIRSFYEYFRGWLMLCFTFISRFGAFHCIDLSFPELPSSLCSCSVIPEIHHQSNNSVDWDLASGKIPQKQISPKSLPFLQKSIFP